MARRHTSPITGTGIAAAAGILLLAITHSASAAAPSFETSCDDVVTASLEIKDHQLKADIVSHDPAAKSVDESKPSGNSDRVSESEFLVPRAESIVREIFKPAKTPLAETTPAVDDRPVSDTTERDELRGVNTRIPGISDAELARYRRQMFRTDI